VTTFMSPTSILVYENRFINKLICRIYLICQHSEVDQ